MPEYFFPNEDVTVKNPMIAKEGFCGGRFINDISIGTFQCSILLTVGNASFGVKLESEILPVSFAVEDIDTWIADELVQFEIGP